jgi:peptidoglycan hydrolase-like amidase
MMDVDMELERSGEVLTHSLDAENTHKFLEWLHLQNGVQISPKVELVTEVGPGKGRGLGMSSFHAPRYAEATAAMQHLSRSSVSHSCETSLPVF